MAMLLWLLVLLAMAWGLADFQLNSRIEPPPLPPVVTPATPRDEPPQAAPEATPTPTPPAESAEAAQAPTLADRDRDAPPLPTASEPGADRPQQEGERP